MVLISLVVGLFMWVSVVGVSVESKHYDFFF